MHWNKKKYLCSSESNVQKAATLLFFTGESVLFGSTLTDGMADVTG